jgi:ribokinase
VTAEWVWERKGRGMQKTIVVVGSINMDMVASVERMPALGETMHGISFATYPGGKGANQAVGAARLGAPVTMIGRLGKDVFATELRESLVGVGVAIEQIESGEGPSGCAVILTTANGENSIVVIGGANQKLTPQDLETHAAEIGNAAIVLAQLETPLETIVKLGAIAYAAKVPFVLDPAPVCALPAELLRTVTWITPNETETVLLMRQLNESIDNIDDTADVKRAAKCLLGAGVRNVLIKMGSKGVYLEGADVAPTFVPAFSVKAVDSTAAGDAFNGGFAYALAVRGFEPAAAARFACAAAALSVTRAGAQPSMPTLDEVERFLSQAEAAR